MMTFHAAANAFPMLDEKRARELQEDISTNGLREPIKVLDGKILDGRNRYQACVAIGIEPDVDLLPNDIDPWAYVWSLNGQRRDLTGDQRYLIWKRCNSGSDEWVDQQCKAMEEANARRSQKAAAGKVGRAAAKAAEFSGSTSCAPTKRDIPEKEAAATRTNRAAASNTNRGTVERMDRLDRERPDLADDVVSGDLKAAEAMRRMKKDQVADRVAELPKDKFRVIYADPPWKYNDSQSGSISDSYGGAEKHYPSMSLTDICALSVEDMAQDDAVLFLWVTSPLLPDGLKVADAWGFKYKSAFIWDKIKHNMGHYNSVRHELLLICTRGSCTPDVAKLFDSVQSIEKTNRHSEKPEAFREIIDTIYPHGRRVELFRRGDAPSGWDVWGNEIEGSDCGL